LQETLQASVGTWRRVKGELESLPRFGIQSELPTFGDGILCFNQSGIQDKFAQGFVARLRRTLQQPLCHWGNANIQSFGAGNGLHKGRSFPSKDHHYHIVLTMATHPQNDIYEEYTLLHPLKLTSVPKLSLNISCLQSDAFIDEAGRVQPVPRMDYVAGTLEDANFKQIMVFLANAEPY
jgi:hypothetical protein